MRQIEKILQEISEEEHLTYQSFADGWILRVGDKFISGYHFAVNDAAASQLCDDKSASYECLKAAGIPAIAHYFFLEMDKARLAQIRSAHGELVLKPNNSSGGENVVRASSITDIFDKAEEILSKSTPLAVSPFTPFSNEYRVIMLDGKVQLMYKKHIQSGWKHNLGLGALPERMEQNQQLAFLAMQAASALDIHFASVDIAETENGLEILEVNSGVMMEYFSAQSDENYQIAKEIYRKAILQQI
ncbi:MAG: ATP-grasp domain-containing protein [Streptococcaceae bacterium]|jgi:glutathione synthase/RimK-type ligase-like ATP-grasp enzyme|nr:ATP-grasp domain-containing protein [Streptococcaceae bacterium]